MIIQVRRGLEANRLSYTPRAGELMFTTDEKKLYVGDGSTAGGILVDMLNGVQTIVAGAGIEIDDTDPENPVISVSSEGGDVISVNGRTGEVIGLAEQSDLQAHIDDTANPHEVTKTQVGLGNVDNTSDANKPVSTAQQTALDLKLNASLKGAANGLAELDSGGLVPTSQLPSYVDDVIEVANFAALPGTGATGKIYVTLDDNKTYRWSGSIYVEISESLALGETSATAYRGDRGKTAYDHTSLTNNPHSVTKAQVGLGNADNTSDANKPVSTAQQTALDLKEDIANLGGLAYEDVVTETEITLADNTTNDFSTTKHGFVPKGTNTGKFLKDDGTWDSIPGGGDMLASTYDPTAVGADAFDMENMAEGATKKILTSTERAKIAFIAVSQSVDLDAIETNANNVPGIKTKTDFITVTQAVDLDQMETDIAALANGMVYKGDWDASAGTFPGSGAAQTGWFYYVTVAGTVDGVSFAIGDNIVAVVDNASTSTYAANWSKHDQTDAVQSVAGKTGAVTLDKNDVSLGNVDNTSDATKLAAAKLAMFPVGSIYINTSNTNPGTFLGGTWAAFGAGRVPVGFDSGQTEFDTDEETGGAKTHTLTIGEIPAHNHDVNTRASKFGSSVGTVFSNNTPDGSASTANAGGGGAHNNLQPYIVVRMWKRTA